MFIMVPCRYQIITMGSQDLVYKNFVDCALYVLAKSHS